MVEMLCLKQAGAPPLPGGNHGAILLEWRGEGTNALPDSGQSMAKTTAVHGEKKKKKMKQHTSMRSSTRSSFLQLVVPSQLRSVVHAVGTCCEPKAAKPVRRSPTSGQRRGRRNGETGPGRRTNQHHGSLPTPESTDGHSVTAHLTTRPDAFTQTCIPPPLMQLLHHGMSQEPTLPRPAYLSARSSTTSSPLRKLTSLPVTRGCRPLRTF
ncbi:hypothetical protein CSHISOI_07758 [Colletotrichum shisoi]|uniref:Uncharacterized protein n=1 Tax=Colletotrichum shisoi TaxID=2078593 RepID=A0A5Q4BL55_9PEZI|nr:hypothetical protein CSHISOI_07758 [Colletotrichum shisoi]